MSRTRASGKPARKGARRRKAALCPACGSAAIPVVHGLPTPAQQRAIDKGEAILSDREEWEGLTQWYCRVCGCDWSGRLRRFKKPGGVDASRGKA